MTFLIMRHGHKAEGNFFNPKLRHQDPPLNEEGNRKAKSIVTYFPERAISSIYISQYLRTRQTIELSAVIDRCSAYTPVPGGVGPMTIATLIAQTVEASENSTYRG